MPRNALSRWNTLATLAVVATTFACADPSTLEPIDAAAARSASTAPAYAVTDLGTLGGSFSIAFGVNNAGHVAGGANTADEQSHFFLWRDGNMTDAGSLGGNANAAINARDELAGLSETGTPDPDGEDFCGFGTHQICLASAWEHGIMRALPTLGGRNAQAANLNERGKIVGLAETGVLDPSCATGTQFQAHRYQAAIWGPGMNDVRALPPLPGDVVGLAIGINAQGQVVGSTGSCATTQVRGRIAGPHAVLWDHGAAVPLDAPGTDNAISVGAAINDRGEIAGGSGTSALRSFLWTRKAGKRDLGTVAGDLGSFATGINATGAVVGVSCMNDALCDTANPELMSRAYLWRDGQMMDLNRLAVTGPRLILLTAFGINDVGQIVGLGFDLESGQPHAYLATPIPGRAARDVQASRSALSVTLPARARALIGWNLGGHR